MLTHFQAADAAAGGKDAGAAGGDNGGDQAVRLSHSM